MAGGIFNNSFDNNTDKTLTGKIHKRESPAILSTVEYGDDKKSTTIIPTILRVTSEEIDYWTKMTCFYDKYWEFDPKLSTVPISFLLITSVTETITAQGAEKRVIVYEAPETIQSNAGFNAVKNSHLAYKNNLEVIMDNVIVQPKQYQMEAIIPESLIGPFHRQGLKRLESLIDYMGLTHGDSKTLSGMSATLQGVQMFLNGVEAVESMTDLILGAGGSSSQMSTINKNSLDAMAAKGRVVLFKKWTGYDYCYGIITKLDVSDKPTEDGVFRASITFQETPILNISKKNASAISGSSIFSIATDAARYVNLGLSLPFLKITGVMDEAGAPGTADNSDDSPGSFFSVFNRGI